MGAFLKVIGFILIGVGGLLTLTIALAPYGITMLIGGVTFAALGEIYKDVKEIKAEVIKAKATPQQQKDST